MTDRTEADAIIQNTPKVSVLPAGDPENELRIIAVPVGWNYDTVDLEQRLETPHRSKGTQYVIDVASFIDEVRRRMGLEANIARIFADNREMKLVAVLNDDPGWRDYRVEYALTRTPEWSHWRNSDDKDLSLEQLARHIEDGMAEIVNPSAADMLELAQTFHATNEATFKRGNRLSTGAQQFIYTEDVKASGGASGTMDIPSELQLKITPFYGSDAVNIAAWFRFTLRGSDLRLSYKIQRPEEVELDAFKALVLDLSGKLDPPNDPGITNGSAPEPRTV